MALENLLRKEGSTFVLRDNSNTNQAIVHIIGSLVQDSSYSVDAHASAFLGMTSAYLGTLGRVDGALCLYDRNDGSVISPEVDKKLIAGLWRRSSYMSIDRPNQYRNIKTVAEISREGKPVFWTNDEVIDDFAHETFASMPECPILLKREVKEGNLSVTMDTREFLYPLEPIRNGKMIFRACYGLAKDFAYVSSRMWI